MNNDENKGHKSPKSNSLRDGYNSLHNDDENHNSFFYLPAILKKLSKYTNSNVDKENFESALNDPAIDWSNDGTYGIINKILEFLGVPIELQPSTFSDDLLKFLVEVQQGVKENKIKKISIEATFDVPFKQFEFVLGEPDEEGIITNSDNLGPNGSINIKKIDVKDESKYIKITNFQGAFHGIKEVNDEVYICFKLNSENFELNWLDTYDLFFKQLSIQPKYSNAFKTLLQAFITYCKQNPEYILESTEPYITQEGINVIAKNVPQIDFKSTWNSLINFINHGASSHNGAVATFIYTLQSPWFYYLHLKTPDVKTYYLMLYGSSGAGKTPIVNLFLEKGYAQKPEEYMFNRNGLNSATRWGMAFSAKYTLPFLADDVDNDLLIQHAPDLKGYTETNNSVVRYDQAIHRRAITGTRYPIITMNSSFVNDNDTGITNRFYKVLYGQKEKNKVDSHAFNSLKDKLTDGFMFAIFNEIYSRVSIDDLIKITRNLNTPEKWVQWGISSINEYAQKNDLNQVLPLDNVETDHDTDRIYDLLNVLEVEHYKEQNDTNYQFHSEIAGMYDIEEKDKEIMHFITPTAYKLINRKLNIPSNTLSEFLRNINAPDIYVEQSRTTHRFKETGNMRRPIHCYVVVQKIKDDIPENSYKIKVLKTFKFGDTTYFAHSSYSVPESTQFPIKLIAAHYFDIINDELENKDQAMPDKHHDDPGNSQLDSSESNSESSAVSAKTDVPKEDQASMKFFSPKFYQYRAIKSFILDGYAFTPGFRFQRDTYLQDLISYGFVECLNCEEKQETNTSETKDTGAAQNFNPAKPIKYKTHYYQVTQNYGKYADSSFLQGSDIKLESSMPIYKKETSEISYGLIKLRIPEKLETDKTPQGWKEFIRDSAELPSEAAYNSFLKCDTQ